MKRKSIIGQGQKEFKSLDIRPTTLEEVVLTDNMNWRRLEDKLSKVQAVIKEPVAVSPQQQSSTITTPQGSVASEWATRYLHNDIKVVGDDVQIISFKDSTDIEFDVTSGSPSLPLKKGGVNAQKVVIGARLKTKEEKVYGILYVNQLPLDPASMPNQTPTSQLYKYDHYHTNPTNRYYGWYVYGLIKHNFNLPHKDRYILNYVDQNSFDVSGLTDEEATIFINRFPEQNGKWEHKGLDSNTIMVSAMYRPDIATYQESVIPELDYIDETNRIIRTNIILYYTLLKG